MEQTNNPPANGTERTNVTALIKSTRPTQIAALPVVAQRAKDLYSTFHGKDAARFYEAEKYHFMKLVGESQGLRNCTPESIYGAFLDLCIHGASLDPSLKQAYMIPRKGKATIVLTGTFEILLRQRAGQLKYADNPVRVYEGDEFIYGTKKGTTFVEHSAKIPRDPNAKLIAVFIKLTRPDGTVDYKVLSREELEDLRKQSEAPNSPAWTKNFAGMAEAKAIKHAFRSYPKPRTLGATKFTSLESENVETTEDLSPDFYSLGDENVDTETGEIREQMENRLQRDDQSRPVETINLGEKGTSTGTTETMGDDVLPEFLVNGSGFQSVKPQYANESNGFNRGNGGEASKNQLDLNI